MDVSPPYNAPDLSWLEEIPAIAEGNEPQGIGDAIILDVIRDLGATGAEVTINEVVSRATDAIMGCPFTARECVEQYVVDLLYLWAEFDTKRRKNVVRLFQKGERDG